MFGEILTGLGAVASGIGAIGNLWQSNQNYQLQRENLDYQKSLQQTIFNREDTALQRRMEDAKAAGLNPYSVINSGGANAGSVVKTEAPQMNFNMNGLMDAINSYLDMQQNYQRTLDAKLETENKEKSGLILSADLAQKNWQNKILGNQFLESQIGVQNDFLNSLRSQAEFNYDFGTDWHYKKDSNGNYDYDKLHTDMDKYIYGKSGTPWYGRQNIYDLSNTINYGILSDYYNNWYKQDVSDTYSIKSAQRQLLEKENSWYNFNQGFDKVTGAIDSISGLLFKGLDFGIRKAEGKSRTRLNNAKSYQIYGENSGYYWDY